jgi:hypothetical protein
LVDVATSTEISNEETPPPIIQDDFFLQGLGGEPALLGASWTYEQLFNDLNLGDLNGQDSWVCDSAFDVENSVKFEGTQGTGIFVSTEIGCYRDISAVDDADFYVAMRKDATANRSRFNLKNGANYVALTAFWEDGNFKAIDNGDWSTIFSYSATNFYVFHFQFDTDLAEYRIQYNDGSAWSEWSGWLTTYLGSTSSITRIDFNLEKTTTYNFYFDTITPNDPVPVPPEPLTILDNVFFGFWYVWGEYFLILWAFGWIISIVAGFIYLLTKR